MFLQLNHQKLEVFKTSGLVVSECYRLSKTLPVEEKFGMISQIRRAALSVYLNIAEAASRKSELERKRYYEIASWSLIEIDAALDIALEPGYFTNYIIDKLGKVLIDCFKMLTGLISSKDKSNRDFN